MGESKLYNVLQSIGLAQLHDHFFEMQIEWENLYQLIDFEIKEVRDKLKPLQKKRFDRDFLPLVEQSRKENCNDDCMKQEDSVKTASLFEDALNALEDSVIQLLASNMKEAPLLRAQQSLIQCVKEQQKKLIEKCSNLHNIDRHKLQKTTGEVRLALICNGDKDNKSTDTKQSILKDAEVHQRKLQKKRILEKQRLKKLDKSFESKTNSNFEIPQYISIPSKTKPNPQRREPMQFDYGYLTYDPRPWRMGPNQSISKVSHSFDDLYFHPKSNKRTSSYYPSYDHYSYRGVPRGRVKTFASDF